MDGLIAQLVEHLTFNQVVQGSSPCQPTNNISDLAGMNRLRTYQKIEMVAKKS